MKAPVTMYKAVDIDEGTPTYFAVCGERMATVYADYTTSNWRKPQGFGDFNSWMSCSLDMSRMVDPEMIWSE
jgi:hypothetical protein